MSANPWHAAESSAAHGASTARATRRAGFAHLLTLNADLRMSMPPPPTDGGAAVRADASVRAAELIERLHAQKQTENQVRVLALP